VTVTGPQGSKSVVTDAEGGFLVPFLTPGLHDLRVELSGFRPVSIEDVTVALGQRATLAPVTMRVGTLTEQVEVVGRPPTVDTSTSSTGASLTADLLERLPTQRRVSDVVQLAAGVAGSGGAGEANPSIAGASGLENQYLIDGINVTNAGYGAVGSYSIVFGSLGSGVPFDFIKEVRSRLEATKRSSASRPAAWCRQ
jgi:hypothetical protein